MHVSSDSSEQERSPAFWDDARMWCLLHQRPWLQLNGSRTCEEPYQEHLDKHPGTEGDVRIQAVRTLYESVRASRPEDLRPEFAQASRNYATALFIHRGLLTEECVQGLASGAVTSDISQAVQSIQGQVIAHLESFDDGDDIFAWLLWVKSPACWKELTA